LFLCLLGLFVVVFSLVLVVAVNGVRTLSVKESRVASVVGVRNILSVEGTADNVVQLTIAVTVETTLFSGSLGVLVLEVGIHSLRKKLSFSSLTHHLVDLPGLSGS